MAMMPFYPTTPMFHQVPSGHIPLNYPANHGDTMNPPIGKKRWAIAEGYLPPQSTGTSRQLVSHETLCLLNAGDLDAQIAVMLYFADREPVGPYRFTVPARRTQHLRFNEFKDPAPVPVDTDYASVIESDQPIVVQHTRLDSRQAELALLSTIAYAADA